MEENTFEKLFRRVKNTIAEMHSLTNKIYEDAIRILRASELREMFRSDTKKVREAYEQNEITREKASEKLKALKYVAKGIGSPVGDLEDALSKIRREFGGVMGQLLEPPGARVPIECIIDDIIGDINREEKDLAKKEFAIREIKESTDIDEARKQISDFCDEYEAGIIAFYQPPEGLKERIRTELQRNLEIKEIGRKLICVFNPP